jgi:hypothetical protein
MFVLSKIRQGSPSSADLLVPRQQVFLHVFDGRRGVVLSDDQDMGLALGVGGDPVGHGGDHVRAAEFQIRQVVVTGLGPALGEEDRYAGGLEL